MALRLVPLNLKPPMTNWQKGWPRGYWAADTAENFGEVFHLMRETAPGANRAGKWFSITKFVFWGIQRPQNALCFLFSQIDCRIGSNQCSAFSFAIINKPTLGAFTHQKSGGRN
jgi:hypothetical protein